MAENIKVTNLGSLPEYQEYTDKDLTLIQEYLIASEFGQPVDYLETFVYDLNGNLLFKNLNNPNYKLNSSGINPSSTTTSVLELFPEQDIIGYGITRGSVNAQYNFHRYILSNTQQTPYWIKEISSDRTELKVTNQSLSAEDISQALNEYRTANDAAPYYADFLLNFGTNKNLIGVNLALGEDIDGEVVLLVKLYEPLPVDVQQKDTFWFVQKLSEPVSYNLEIKTPAIEEVITGVSLRGPNFNIALNQRTNQTIEEYDYNTLFSSNISSSYQQIKSLLDEKGIEINVDYSDFNNFIHFSSAVDRIDNFTYKVQLIESYSVDLDTLDNVSGTTTIVNTVKEVVQGKINNIIEKFDDYEYYLYFNSSSATWPKSTTVKPYQLYSVTSSQAINWLGSTTLEPTTSSYSILYSASYYDNQNKDIFTNTIPSYLLDDSSNDPYRVFLSMIGQYFDNIWLYLKDVTEKFDASNSLTAGISKDLIANTLKGLGINLYTNTNISDNLYYSILGINQDGSLIPPTGSEVIDHYFTASIETIPAEDLTLEYYKRIYHNLPYLLKTKGTERGLRALINCFGIPDTILKINEYGGYTKSKNTSTYVDPRHTLALSMYGNQYIQIPWAPIYYEYLSTGNANIVPDTIEFRFHKSGIPSSSAYYTSSLITKGGTNSHLTNDFDFQIQLTYDPTASIEGGPYEKYGSMVFKLNGSYGPLITSPIYLPFYDETQWWNVMVYRETGSLAAVPTINNKYWLYVQSTFYNEEGIAEVGFAGSASISVNGSTQSSYNTKWNDFDPDQASSYNLYLGATMSYAAIDSNWIDTYFQEFRYWASPLTLETFTTHTLNAASYVGNTPTSSKYELVYRLPLGNELNVVYNNIGTSTVEAIDYQQYEIQETEPTALMRLNSQHPSLTGFVELENSTQVFNGLGSFINGGAPYSDAIYGSNSGLSEYYKFTPFRVVDIVQVPTLGLEQKTNNKIIIADQNENLQADNDGYLNQNFTGTVLSPYTSLYKESTDKVLSSPALEVAFSPTDAIDRDIISELGYFNIDDYIGGISDAYETSYSSLEELRRKYFQKYISKFNIWDFVRVIKYIDNSLFKMIVDFVPAKANLSTGVVVKSDTLYRPKYPRYSPSVIRSEYTQSIDTAFITGSSGLGRIYNTSYTASYTYASSSFVGPTGIIRNDSRELITGELGGTILQARDSRSFTTTEVSNVAVIDSSWTYKTNPLNYLQNNVSESLRSSIYYDLDFNTNALTPVNFNLITYSIEQYSQGNALYDNAIAPYARIQDFNYFSRANLRSKYEGAKTTSRLYSTYSIGDSSYGKSAAIDKIKYQYAYLVDIYTASLTLPSRSNAQIKYLIDDKEDVVDLTKSNYNIFDIQNIFKSGETVNISLFNYTNTQQTNNPAPGFISLLDKDVIIYEGGYRYYPMIHNLQGTSGSYRFFYSEPVATVNTYTAGLNCTNDPSNTNLANFSIPNQSFESAVEAGETLRTSTITVAYNGAVAIGNCPVVITLVGSKVVAPDKSNPDVTTLINAYLDVTFNPGDTTLTISDRDATYGCTTYYDTDPILANSCRSGFYWRIQSLDYISTVFYTYTVVNVGTSLTLSLNVCPNNPGDSIAPTAVAVNAGQTVTVCATDQSMQPYLTNPNLQITRNALCCQGNTITTITYSTTATDPQPCLRWNASNVVEFSEFITNQTLENKPILFDQRSDPAMTAGASIEPIYYPLEITTGDGIHFSDSRLGWSEQEEYRIVRKFYSGSGTGIRLCAELDKSINSEVTETGEFGSTICKYIIAKHVPDETNLILRYNPFENGRVEEGLAFPQYLSDPVRTNSGNVIKSLRSQGLI